LGTPRQRSQCEQGSAAKAQSWLMEHGDLYGALQKP
jgi:hypothetical protein